MLKSARAVYYGKWRDNLLSYEIRGKSNSRPGPERRREKPSDSSFIGWCDRDGVIENAATVSTVSTVDAFVDGCELLYKVFQMESHTATAATPIQLGLNTWRDVWQLHASLQMLTSHSLFCFFYSTFVVIPSHLIRSNSIPSHPAIPSCLLSALSMLS
jgi:hypothetical protein